MTAIIGELWHKYAHTYLNIYEIFNNNCVTYWLSKYANVLK